MTITATLTLHGIIDAPDWPPLLDRIEDIMPSGSTDLTIFRSWAGAFVNPLSFEGLASEDMPEDLHHLLVRRSLAYIWSSGAAFEAYCCDRDEHIALSRDPYTGSIVIPLHDVDDEGIVADARRWQAWMDSRAPLIIEPSRKESASPRPAPASRGCELEAAMCLWEAALEALRRAHSGEARRTDFGLEARVEYAGTPQLRHDLMALIEPLDEAWSLYRRSGASGLVPYDWEFVPWFLDECAAASEDGVTVKPDYLEIVRKKAAEDMHAQKAALVAAGGDDGD